MKDNGCEEQCHAVSGRVKRGDRRTITESPSWR